MSNLRTREWLLSQNHNQTFSSYSDKKLKGKAKTISVTSGKGGVGKTSISLKIGQLLSEQGFKTLVIDCDYNLANTAVKLGVPLNNNFQSYLNNKIDFESCLYREDKFHLLSGCNGDLDLFDSSYELDRVVIETIVAHESDYDFIILDSPAGIQKETLTLNAYSDYRFVVVTPDKSSITDSYSLMKILNTRFGVNDNHLLINKVSSNSQYNRMVRTLSETVDNFLDCRLNILGGLPFVAESIDQFDKTLLKSAGSEIHKKLNKVLHRFTDDHIGNVTSLEGVVAYNGQQIGHEVQTVNR